jgi:hypothetical protein
LIRIMAFIKMIMDIANKQVITIVVMLIAMYKSWAVIYFSFAICSLLMALFFYRAEYLLQRCEVFVEGAEADTKADGGGGAVSSNVD